MASVILYLLVFSFAAISASFVQKKIAYVSYCPFGKQLLYAGFIMLMPIIIACWRYDIGIDYATYEKTFTTIHNLSLADYQSVIGSYEYLNKFIVDLGFCLAGNVTGVFSAYAIATLILYEMALLNFRKYISLPTGTLILLLLLFSASLNIVRQSLSIAIIFYSMKFVIERNIKAYIILILIATGIHSSSFIAIIFYFLYSERFSFKNRIIRILIILSPLFFISAVSYISGFVIFERYFESYDSTETDITKSYIIKLPILLLLLLSYKQLKKSDISGFFYYMYIMEWALLFSASVFKWAFRLSYYSYIGQIILLAMASKKGIGNAWFYKSASILWYLIYFYILFYLWGRDGIFPYKML